jgi:hypothetical protein
MVNAGFSRRQFFGLSAGAAAFVVLRPTSADAVTATQYADRAVAAYNAQQKYLYVSNGTSLYRETYPRTGNPYSYLWPFSQATAATVDVYGINPPRVSINEVRNRYLGGLPRYWNSSTNPPGYDSYVRPPYGSGGDKFYDDNAWVGLSLVRVYRMTGDTSALNQARAVFTLITYGWDTNESHVPLGGVFWTQAPWSRDRNTVSNAPSAELAFRLYQLTAEQSYLDWGVKMYDWVNAYLRDPSDGLYWDHLDTAGVIEKTKWSYNQGTMLGANVLLYQIHAKSGSPSAGSFLQQAEGIARKSLDYYANVYFSQEPPFNAIYFRNLLALCAVTGDSVLKGRILSAAQAYADEAWGKNRASSNLFYFPAGSSPARLQNQAAMVEILSCLAWSAAKYDLLV